MVGCRMERHISNTCEKLDNDMSNGVIKLNAVIAPQPKGMQRESAAVSLAKIPRRIKTSFCITKGTSCGARNHRDYVGSIFPYGLSANKPCCLWGVLKKVSKLSFVTVIAVDCS